MHTHTKPDFCCVFSKELHRIVHLFSESPPCTQCSTRHHLVAPQFKSELKHVYSVSCMSLCGFREFARVCLLSPLHKPLCGSLPFFPLFSFLLPPVCLVRLILYKCFFILCHVVIFNARVSLSFLPLLSGLPN